MLENYKTPVKLKISAAWASVLFLAIYADYFKLYTDGKIEAVSNGIIGPFKVTDTVLLGLSTIMVVPSFMIFLSVALPPSLNRWSNVIVALVYGSLVAMTLPGAESFWILFGAGEVLLCLLIVWYALRWPKQATAA